MVVNAGQTVQLGQLERTARAFWQEASEAMRGDIVRALVEFITNADDAYARAGRKGRILVEVEHRRGDEPWMVTVRDRASGMTLGELRDNIGRQGARTSGFERGVSVRGNLGLGAKDPACFGRVIFETIKGGLYARFEVDDQGERTSINKPVKVTDEMRTALKLPTNGTIVTLEVRHAIPRPRHDTLKYRLSNHVLLRDIMQDTNREVFLLHANKPGARPERLRYERPHTDLRVHERSVPVPGFPGATAEISISEAKDPFQDEGPRSATRQSGLLIKGRRAIYECSLFGLEGNPYALAFSGWIRSEDIDRLADEYSDRSERREAHPEDNPIPIISRRRDGLAEEHPFYAGLKQLADAKLQPLVAAREERAKERSRAVENESTSRLLSQLAKAAAKFMQEAADEEDLELTLTRGDQPAPALAIYPGAKEIPTNSETTLTIVAAKDSKTGPVEVGLECTPPDVVQIQPSPVHLGPSRRRDDVLTGTVRVTGGPALGATLLVARLGALAADCAIEVVEPEAAPEPIPPEELEFERQRYRVVTGKPKSLKLRAPLDTYADGTEIKVSSDRRAVVVLDGGRVVLHRRPLAAAMEGHIRVEGRAEQGTAKITAVGPDGQPAATTAHVVPREESGADFETKLVDEYQGDQRAQWTSDYRTLRIMGEHPAVNPHLGAKEDGYPGQTSPQFRLLTAELVADAVVRRIILQKYKEDELDAGTLYVHHNRLVARFLARAHKLVAETA